MPAVLGGISTVSGNASEETDPTLLVAVARKNQPFMSALTALTVSVAVAVPENAAPSVIGVQFAPPSVERCHR